MPHDVFLCYCSSDKAVADVVRHALEREGIRALFRSDRDQIDARNPHDAQVIVLIFSRETNRSTEIDRTIELANAMRIPIVVFRIEDVMPSGRFGSLVYLDQIDAVAPPYELHLKRLVDAVKRKLEAQRARRHLSDSDLLDYVRSRGTSLRHVEIDDESRQPPLDQVFDEYRRRQSIEDYRSVESYSVGSRAPTSAPPEPEAYASARGASKASLIVLLCGAALACGATIALFRNRQEIGAFFGWLAKSLFHSSAPAAPAIGSGETVADVSVYAPPRTTRGDTFLVQVFAHNTDDDERMISEIARAADFAAVRRGVATLDIEIAYGDRLDFTLDAPGFVVEETVQTLIWRNKPRSCGFRVSVPNDFSGSTVSMRVRVFRQAVPVGQINFSMNVTDVETQELNQPRGESAPRFRRAFLSYSSSDRAEVIKRAQALRALRVDFFNDLLSIEPGEQWEQRLYKEIERCDLFLLFWSHAARESAWVNKEIDHALACHREILPIILEGPPPPAPPDSLTDRHFNDPLLYVIAAVEKLAASHPAA